jgi:hypothetical protein
MNRRRLLAPATAALVVLDAGRALAGFPLSPSITVRVTSWGPGTATVCAWGVVDDGTAVAGVWSFTVAGAAVIATPAGAGPVGTGPSYYTCLTIATGATAAVFVATLTYTGAGTADPAGVGGLVGIRTSATTPGAVTYSTSV